MKLINQVQQLNPSLKANAMDSLHYLMEINMQVDYLKKGEITEEDFINFMFKRSEEYGYISDYSHSYKVYVGIRDLETTPKEKEII